jgi:hypothetical protein
MARSKALTRADDITGAILVFRGQRVILDRELAASHRDGSAPRCE